MNAKENEKMKDRCATTKKRFTNRALKFRASELKRKLTGDLKTWNHSSHLDLKYQTPIKEDKKGKIKDIVTSAINEIIIEIETMLERDPETKIDNNAETEAGISAEAIGMMISHIIAKIVESAERNASVITIDVIMHAKGTTNKETKTSRRIKRMKHATEIRSKIKSQ